MLLFALCALQTSSPHLVYSLPGPSPADRTGMAVAIAGDVDRDGFADILVGAPGMGTAGPRSGSARVYSGKSGALIHTFVGDDPYDELGAAVAGAGDVDGDGHADLLLGAPAGSPASGEVRLYSGADGALLAAWSGSQPGERFGSSLAAPGDLDGDGVPDIAIGAPHDSQGAQRRGAVLVYSGADSSGAPGKGPLLFRREGKAWDFFGSSLATVGDVDGDGTADLVVGSPFDDGSAFNAGSAFVISGSDGSQLLRLDGVGIGDQFGACVDGAGDVDGDGTLDVLVGAPGFDGVGIDVGRVEVRSGKDGRLIRSDTGSASGDGLFVCAGLGDVDDDGHADFVTGAPSAGDGLQDEAGRVRLISGRTGALLQDFLGSATSATGTTKRWFGAALAGSPTLLGDAAPGFVVGAPGHDDAPGTGRAEVLSAAPRSLSSETHELPLGTGGVQEFRLRAGSPAAGLPYYLLGTAAGASPGVLVNSLLLPLNPEPTYFRHTLRNPNSAPLSNSSARLDSFGEASASFTLPGGAGPALAGLLLHHAFVVFDPGGAIVFASNAVSTLLLP